MCNHRYRRHQSRQQWRHQLTPTPTLPPPTGARSPDTADGDANVAALAPSDGNAVVTAESAELIFKALSWSLSTKEEGILVHVARSLPKAALDEQIRAYLCEQERATTTLAVPNTTLAVPNAKVVAPVAVNVNHLKSRMQVAALYDKYLEDMGCKGMQRVPRGTLKDFTIKYVSWGKDVRPIYKKTRQVK